MKLPIVEIFASLQGEGPRIRPAVFIRTALCSLKCPGFCCKLKAPDGTIIQGCDTIRAVSPKFKSTWTYFEDFNDILEVVREKTKIWNKVNYDVVFTGGEPLLHWNNDIFQNLLKHFITENHKVTIETNTTPNIKISEDYQKEIIFSCSVKLSNSGEPREKRLNFKNLDEISKANMYFKFVVNPKTWDNDFLEITEIIKDRDCDVYLMPLGGNQEELSQNTKFVVEKCIENGFCYSDRIHIRAFNTKEGV